MLFSELFSYCHLKFRGTDHYGDTAYCVNAEDLVLDAIWCSCYAICYKHLVWYCSLMSSPMSESVDQAMKCVAILSWALPSRGHSHSAGGVVSNTCQSYAAFQKANSERSERIRRRRTFLTRKLASPTLTTRQIWETNLLSSFSILCHKQALPNRSFCNSWDLVLKDVDHWNEYCN